MFSSRHSVSGRTGSFMATRSGDNGFQKGGRDYAHISREPRADCGQTWCSPICKSSLRSSLTEQTLHALEEMLDIARRTADEAWVRNRVSSRLLAN
jgi:hypothetical protein